MIYWWLHVGGLSIIRMIVLVWFVSWKVLGETHGGWSWSVNAVVCIDVFGGYSKGGRQNIS